MIVIAMRNPQPCPRTNPALLQKFQQPAVTLINATYLNMLAGFGLRQQQKSAPPATGRAFQFGQIAMRTRDSAP